MTDGWPRTAECIELRGRRLSLPEGIGRQLDVLPEEHRHGLWLQFCCSSLFGLDQATALTLVDEEQHLRIDEFLDLLRRHRDDLCPRRGFVERVVYLIRGLGDDVRPVRWVMVTLPRTINEEGYSSARELIAVSLSGVRRLNEAIPYLIALLHDEDREMVEYAVRSLSRIGGDAVQVHRAPAEQVEQSGFSGYRLEGTATSVRGIPCSHGSCRRRITTYDDRCFAVVCRSGG